MIFGIDELLLHAGISINWPVDRSNTPITAQSVCLCQSIVDADHAIKSAERKEGMGFYIAFNSLGHIAMT